MPQNRNFVLAIIIGAVLLIVLTLMMYAFSRPQMAPAPLDTGLGATGTPPGGKYCTMEAKLCPDGSSVGRQPPNCEFAPCPGAPSAPTPSPRPTAPAPGY